MTGRVLVTGGAGYVGSHVVLALLEAGWRVTVLDDLSTGLCAAVPSEAAFVRGDVGDELRVRELLRDFGACAVIHLAGLTSASQSVANPLRYFENNTGRSRALISAAVAAGVNRFIFSSTAAVYGEVRTGPVNEDAPTRPMNPYGASKLMTEQMLAHISQAHGLRYAALRYFNVGGSDPQGRLGRSAGAATTLLEIALDTAEGLRPTVPVFGTDHPTRDGTGVRDYIHVSDVADAHVCVLEALDGPTSAFTLNVGYGRGASVFEVLDAAERVTGVRLKREIQPARAGDPAEVVADNTRILRTTKWRPARDSLDQMLTDSWAWRRARHAG